MKYNLKNFNIGDMGYHCPNCLGRCNAYKYLEWKRGFEKELRAKLKFQSKYHVVPTYGMRIMMEILGDGL